VQEQQQRILALAPEDVDRAAERRDPLALPPPVLYALGQ